MEKKEVSTFLLSLVSTLSLLNNKKDIIDQLLKGLNSVYEKAEFEFCCDDEPEFYCFKFYNGEGIITRFVSSLSNHDFILIQESVDIVSAFLEKIELRENNITAPAKEIPCVQAENERNIRRLQEEIRKRLIYERRLKESEEKNRLILDNSVDAIILTTPDGSVLAVNSTACEVFGMSESEIIAAGRKGLVDQEDPRLSEMLEERERTGQVRGELFFFRKDGTRFEGELSSSVFLNRKGQVRTSMVIRDISRQKKTESRLLLLSHAVEESPLSIVITDSKGRIKYVNGSFANASGFSAAEALGQEMKIVNSGKQTRAFYENMWNTILKGKGWGGELINKRKNGELYWEYITISPIKSSKGVITHFVSVREDITEKKKMIDDLVIAKEQAEESDRLKTAFLANISHEIRTPMNGILGFLELLKNPNLQEEEKDGFIDLVNKSGDRLLATINDLIEISKIESGQVKADYNKVDVREVMEYYLKFFKPLVKKNNLGIKIACQISREKSLVKTDRLKVDVALSNLISNAIKFTEKGSVEFGNYIEGDSLVFFVRDTGIGIATDQMDAVFDRFVQADLNMTKPYQGTGLGLSIIKGYIRLLKGKIWVESEVGKGSVFYFSIPYYPVNI
jgi:PAS domain S-box-containing protein